MSYTTDTQARVEVTALQSAPCQLQARVEATALHPASYRRRWQRQESGPPSRSDATVAEPAGIFRVSNCQY